MTLATPTITERQEYRNFINSIKSPATLKSYNYSLKYFMRYCKTDIPGLLKGDTKTLEQQIIEFLVEMRQVQKLSYGIINTRLAAIKKFYDMNDQVFNWKKISSYLPENIRINKDRAYTIEEIQNMLSKCDERMRVVILLLVSTGVRLGAAVDLKLKHLTKIEKYKLYQITIYENTSSEYYVFTTTECALAIDSYLEYRTRFNEKLSGESPLIREQFNRKDSLLIRHPKPLRYHNLAYILTDILVKAGIQTVEHVTETKLNGRIRKDVKRANGFRKFTETSFIRSKVGAEARELLMGHSIGLGDNYYRPLPEELLNEYLLASDALTINSENRLKRRVEILEVKKEKIDQLAATLETVKAKLGI
jgi:site-specific recombinase XerD